MTKILPCREPKRLSQLKRLNIDRGIDPASAEGKFMKTWCSPSIQPFQREIRVRVIDEFWWGIKLNKLAS